MQQIVIIKINFIAPPAEIVAEVMGQCAFGGDVRRERPDGDVISVDWSKGAVVARLAGLKNP